MSGRAVRAAKAPVLDGREDDEVWQNAPIMDDFRQFDPAEDGDPSFRTEIKAAYDDRNFYVLVRAYDPHPDSLIALLSRRDVRTQSDQIKIMIDAYHDHRTGVEMAVNPAGVKRDANIYGDVVEDLTWDGVWDAATRVDEKGWVAEFSIPFSQLRFSNVPTHTFGFGVWRDIARKNERVAWPVYRPSRPTLASQLGDLEGIDGIQRSGRLEILPYVVTKNVTERSSPTSDWSHPQQISAGADLKYGFTPNLTLDATVNPDFGQVESDPAVLNLTAFEIRFDERRPFFQEGVGLFRCQGPCEGIFYTRRVGRTPQLRGPNDPAFTTILGAGKLTGRIQNGMAGGLVGALTARETGEGGRTIEPRTSYLVGRLVKEMRQGRSQLGGMITAVNRELDDDTRSVLRREAYTALIQGFHRFAQERWELMGYAGFNRVEGSPDAIAFTQRNSVHFYQRPDHEEQFDPTRTALAGQVVALQIQKLGGSFGMNSVVRHASPGIELNDLGFVPLVNDFSWRNNFSVRTLRPGKWYRRLFSQLSTEQHWTTGGLPSGTSGTIHTSAELLNSWGTALTYSASALASTHCVACARGGPAVRQSPRQSLRVDVSGDRRTVIIPTFTLSTERGDDGNSHAVGAELGADMRVASRFSMSVAADYDDRVEDQQWVANVGSVQEGPTSYTFARLDQRTLGVTARANFTASPTLSLQLYAQPFVSTGDFSDWRALSAPRAASYDDRYRPFRPGEAPPGFEFKQFNSNAVVRWEYRPGSTLFVVWQQGRIASEQILDGTAASTSYRDLFRSHPDNTILVKISYWFNP